MEKLMPITEQAKMENKFEDQIENSDDEYADDDDTLDSVVASTEQEVLELMLQTAQEIESSDEECDLAEDALQHKFSGNDTLNGDPEGHLPYSCSVLTKELTDYAAKYLNETEAAKKRGLKELREFIKNEMNIDFDIEDAYLLCFLRTKKYDLKKTIQLMKRGSKFAESHRNLFDRDDLPLVRRVVDSKVVGFLPYRDAMGRAIVFVKAECWNPDEIKADDLIYGCITALHVGMDNELNQVAGFVVVFDFKKVTMKQFKEIARWIVVGLQAIQKFCPCMVKELHVVNMPAVFRGVWKVVRKFLSAKIRNRISFYKSAQLKSFRKKIPPSILPAELGGLLGPYSPEHWTRDLEKRVKIHNERAMKFLNRRKKN